MFLAIKEENIKLFLKKTEKKRMFMKSLKKKSRQFHHIIEFLGTCSLFFTLNKVKTFFIFTFDFKPLAI